MSVKSGEYIATLSIRANSIYQISGNEFARVKAHPLNPALVGLLGAFAVLFSLSGLRTEGGNDSGLYLSFGTYFMYSAIFYGIVSVFIGVTSVAEERRNHAINILLTKPLYRRDVVLGKILGLNVYVLCIIASVLSLTAVILIFVYTVPADPADFLARVGLYILILFLYSSLHIAIAMIVGSVLKDLLIAASIVSAFIFFDWYYHLFGIIPGLSNIDPQAALCHLYINDRASLQSTTSTIQQWINANTCSLFWFIVAIIVLLFVNIIIYTKEEIS